MQNDPGYKIIDGSSPPRPMIDAAKAEISLDDLKKLRSTTSELGFARLGWGPSCNDLLHYGLKLDNDPYVNQLLHGPYRDDMIHMNEVVVWMENPTQLKRMKAGRKRIFIYKPMEETLSPQNGFLKIVDGSHRMSSDQIFKATATEIQLLPGQVIAMDGELVIEYPKEGGGGLGLLMSMHKYENASKS